VSGCPVTLISVLVLSIAAAACGESPSTSSSAVASLTGTIGGFVSLRTPGGDNLLRSTDVNAWVEDQRTEHRLVTNGQGRYMMSGLPPGSRVWMSVRAMTPECALVTTASAGHVEYNIVVYLSRPAPSSAPDPPGLRSISGVAYEAGPSGRIPLAEGAAAYDVTWPLAGGGTASRSVSHGVLDGAGRFRLCGLPQSSGGNVVVGAWDDIRSGRVSVPPGPSLDVEIDVS
jgi:hypothetical protein